MELLAFSCWLLALILNKIPRAFGFEITFCCWKTVLFGICNPKANLHRISNPTTTNLEFTFRLKKNLEVCFSAYKNFAQRDLSRKVEERARVSSRFFGFVIRKPI
jgi:hypothetical protein